MLSNKAKLHLSLCYGDKERCLKELQETIDRYYCIEIKSEKVKSRIIHYQNIIEEIKTTNPPSPPHRTYTN